MTEGTPWSEAILAALVAGIALLTALRRSERVPYFG